MENNKPTSVTTTVFTILLLIFFFPIGLILMWIKTNWNTKVKWGITGLFGFFLLLGAISSAISSKSTVSSDTQVATTNKSIAAPPTATPGPTKPPTPTPTLVPKDINGFPEDAEAVTVADLDKAPSQYDGKKLTFTCIVAGFAKDSSGNTAAVNCSDPNDFSSLIQVNTSAFDMTKIRQSDTVKFYGLGAGSATGKNAYGGDVSESLVSGVYINDITSGYKE